MPGHGRKKQENDRQWPSGVLKGMEGKEVCLFKASRAFQLMTKSKVVFLALEHHLSLRCAGQGSWPCGLLHLCGFSHFSFLQENCLLSSSSAGLGFRVHTYGVLPLLITATIQMTAHGVSVPMDWNKGFPQQRGKSTHLPRCCAFPMKIEYFIKLTESNDSSIIL